MPASAGEPTAGRVPSARVIRARPHTGQPPGGYGHTWPRSTAQAGVSLQHPAAVPAVPPPAASRDPTSQHEIREGARTAGWQHKGLTPGSAIHLNPRKRHHCFAFCSVPPRTPRRVANNCSRSKRSGSRGMGRTSPFEPSVAARSYGGRDTLAAGISVRSSMACWEVPTSRGIRAVRRRRGAAGDRDHPARSMDASAYPLP